MYGLMNKKKNNFRHKMYLCRGISRILTKMKKKCRMVKSQRVKSVSKVKKVRVASLIQLLRVKRKRQLYITDTIMCLKKENLKN